MTKADREKMLNSNNFVHMEIIVPYIDNITKVKPYSIYERKGVSDFMLYNMVKFLEYGIELIKKDMVTPYEVIDSQMKSKVIKDNIIEFPRKEEKND